MTTLESPQLDFPYYTTKKGEVPFWDHPYSRGYKVIPRVYRPITTLQGVLALYQRAQLKEEDVTILKVLGDSICSNEDQLKRYLSSKMTASQVTKKLKRFRELSFVDRWNVRIIGDEETKPPSPFTLGIGGYKFLKHYYNQDFFMDPERWDRYGIKGIQRYVATNEVRCRMVEAGVLRNWKWHAIINDSPHLTRPLGVAEVESPKGRINMIIERPQMSQDFMGYLREKLNLWKAVYDKDPSFKISDLGANRFILLIYASTLSIAQSIQKELMLDLFPFPIWFCVEEDMYSDGLDKACYRPDKENLKRMKVDFLSRQ